MGVDTTESRHDSARISEDTLEQVAREYGVVEGQPRHGETAMRWSPGMGMEFRDDAGVPEGHLGVLHGHFAVFDRWTEINSLFEGRFMERLAPGAFKKTFAENRGGMRCLVQHGRDPQVGMKPLGPINELREDELGGYYEVPLLDTSYNRDLLPGLRSGLYGASFRFQVIREDVDRAPKRSEHNPEGIEERTIREVRVREFGPVTFPAYEDASAGVRSLNDLMLGFDLDLFSAAHPDSYPARLAELLQALRTRSASASPAAETPSTSTAPPPRAPERDLPDRTRPRPTRLSGAAGTLKTSRRLQEAPRWKL